MMAKPRHDNVSKSYLYTFVSSFGITDAIWMLYLAHKGMDLVQIGLLESIFHVTSLFMEIPTGIVADRLGRKTSRVLSRVAAFCAALLMIAAHDFPGFVVAFVFTALSYNLESGAGDALVYDSLLDQGREGEYMRVKGRQEIAYQVASSLSLVAGGVVATWDYGLAYLITAGIHLCSLALALGFSEPLAGRKGHAGGRGRGSLRDHVADSLREIRSNRGVFLYILFIETFSLFYTTLWFYFQNFLKERGYREWAIGLVLAGSSAVAALTATVAHRVEARLGRRRVVSFLPFLALAAFGLIAFTSLEPWAMIVLAAAEGFLFVSFSDYINRLIPSASRATLLSFQAMVFSMMMIVFFPVIGAVSKAWGFKTAFAAIFAVSLVVLPGARAMLLGRLDRQPAPARGD